MNQLESAALTLAGITLAFLTLVFGIWWMRRPRTVPAAPRIPRPPRAVTESRLPKLSRKAQSELDDVKIAPARLARISRQAPLDEIDEPQSRPAPGADRSVAIETMLEAIVAEVEDAARPTDQSADECHAEQVTLRLVPQIPPRDAISTNSWLGGCPRMPAGMEWPRIDHQPADFLAQIHCADLPRDLWGGLGPREGALAFFIHRHKLEMCVLHLRETGAPVAPPFALNDVEGWFGPQGGLGQGDLASFAVRAFPEWPVDLVAIGPDDPDLREEGDPEEAGRTLYDRGYDIADPAFHPFDWGSMTMMVTILEMRLDQLIAEAASFAGSGTEDTGEMERRVATNREARIRAEEIIAIVHDSTARDMFSASDVTAVMSALHAIHWAKAIRTVDPETGAERLETITLPLTTHRSDANLWVHDYQTILFDRAKHAWCADPNSLSPPARAFYEPWWRELAAREMAAMGHVPLRHLPDYDEERDVVIVELPTSGLMSRVFGDSDNLVVTIDKADLAIGDFSKLRVQLTR